MLFNSFEYLIFLPIVVILYNLIPEKFKNVFLLLASLTFYSFWNVKYTFLMILSIAITFFTGIYIDRHSDKMIKNFAVFICFFINLGILFIFKYFNFTVDLINSAFYTNYNFEINVLLPVGISFYTFQALGYTIDVYRGDIAAERNFVNYALFVSFFPQLVAGPIERSTNLLPQIKKRHKFEFENLIKGLQFLVWGLFLKLVIADRAAILVDELFNDYSKFSSFMLIIGAILFTVQIYCDFYSYSIIAKGSAKIIGIDLMYNFREPFLSKSIVEFWRRWHISLSTWFKDYLYIPLGGNRKGKIRKYLNLLIIFLVSGLWHGAELSFILWGLIHGLFNVFENTLKNLNLKRKDNFLINSMRRIYTFSIVVFAFIYFRAANIFEANAYIEALIKNGNKGSLLNEFSKTNFAIANIYPLIGGIIILIIVDILRYKEIKIWELTRKIILPIRWIVYYFFLFATIIFGIYGPGFSESAFIYFQF